jgi:signal transduction histidine kinase
VDVEVSYGDDLVTIRVRDYGPGPADGELLPGHGLVGMRDRATVAGGTFSAGAANGRGFVVEATLPITGDPA